MICHVFKQKGSRVWRGRYRLDGEGVPTDVPLGVTDKQVAEEKLRGIVRDAEREAAGIAVPKVQREAAQKPLLDHLADYMADLKSLGRDDDYVYIVDRRARRLIAECGWRVLKDVTPETFRAWRNRQTSAAKTRNEYLHAISGLLNWLAENKQLPANPLDPVEAVDTRGKERRKRRAYTDAQARSFLAASGQWRAVYLTALLTGLRRGELKSLIWAWVHLDAPKPFIYIPADVDKDRDEQQILLHRQVIDVLRAIRPANASPADRVFPKMPRMDHHQQILKAAGIPYMDELGRQADFHALRHTFDTNLARYGAPERIRMHMMRHKTRRMTSDVYTDVSQLPIAETMDRLPGFAEPKSPSQLASQNPDTTVHSGALPVPQLFIFGIPQPVGNQAEGHAGARPDTVVQKSENGCLARTRT
jgi:integrase